MEQLLDALFKKMQKYALNINMIGQAISQVEKFIICLEEIEVQEVNLILVIHFQRIVKEQKIQSHYYIELKHQMIK